MYLTNLNIYLDILSLPASAAAAAAQCPRRKSAAFSPKTLAIWRFMAYNKFIKLILKFVQLCMGGLALGRQRIDNRRRRRLAHGFGAGAEGRVAHGGDGLERRRGPREALAGELRPRRDGRRPARYRRLPPHPGRAPPRHKDAHHDMLGPRRGLRAALRPRPRRGRLYREALQPRRPLREGAGAHTPQPGHAARGCGDGRALQLQYRHAALLQERRRDSPLQQGERDDEALHGQRRPRLLAQPPLRPRLGRQPRGREHGDGLHIPPARQD